MPRGGESDHYVTGLLLVFEINAATRTFNFYASLQAQDEDFDMNDVSFDLAINSV